MKNKKSRTGKMRSDSTWNQLSAEQRLRFEAWLFDENLSYQAARDWAEKEFGVAGSVASVGRYYRHRSETVDAERRASGPMLAALLKGTGVDADGLRTAAQKAMGMRFLQVAMEGRDVKEMCALGRLMLNTEWSEIERERMELARKRRALYSPERMNEHLAQFAAINRMMNGESGNGTTGKCG